MLTTFTVCLSTITNVSPPVGLSVGQSVFLDVYVRGEGGDLYIAVLINNQAGSDGQAIVWNSVTVFCRCRGRFSIPVTYLQYLRYCM